MTQAQIDAITGAADWTTVATGIGTIAAGVATVVVVIAGAKMLVRMLRTGG
ncbi:MAG: hypothetical protein P1U47_11990 [Zhongshania sp.]|uniref:hypothetical protein n=1 Tax=Zhongshania sp. TaxID=1971902 RepID=UPI00261903C1|nr:hypothetical protein [Zhongshania sp.]MDF1693090.1 hypothetical protein [Zhongshania sp.]